jgi:ring-1,2-phenylacetyl-CoA epoxidase subunit PaaD
VHPVEVAVRKVRDPELGNVTIGELGLVRSVVVDEQGHASVTLVSTFSGCPALHLIAADARTAAINSGARSANIRYDQSIPWTTASVTVEGRASLADLGIAVANVDGSEPSCPFCESTELTQVSPVGPAACRSAWWCCGCRNVVEVFRDSSLPSIPSIPSMPIPFPTRRDQYVHV